MAESKKYIKLDELSNLQTKAGERTMHDPNTGRPLYVFLFMKRMYEGFE